jgi:hypothetical protein
LNPRTQYLNYQFKGLPRVRRFEGDMGIRNPAGKRRTSMKRGDLPFAYELKVLTELSGEGHREALSGDFQMDRRKFLDERCTEFFKGILAELASAAADGANVRAFHAWRLMDNFEWTDGYSQRYRLT